MGHISISITLFILTYCMVVAKLLPREYYSVEEVEIQEVIEYSNLGVHTVRWLGNRLAII